MKKIFIIPLLLFAAQTAFADIGDAIPGAVPQFSFQTNDAIGTKFISRSEANRFTGTDQWHDSLDYANFSRAPVFRTVIRWDKPYDVKELRIQACYDVPETPENKSWWDSGNMVFSVGLVSDSDFMSSTFDMSTHMGVLARDLTNAPIPACDGHIEYTNAATRRIVLDSTTTIPWHYDAVISASTVYGENLNTRMMNPGDGISQGTGQWQMGFPDQSPMIIGNAVNKLPTDSGATLLQWSEGLCNANDTPSTPYNPPQYHNGCHSDDLNRYASTTPGDWHVFLTSAALNGSNVGLATQFFNVLGQDTNYDFEHQILTTNINPSSGGSNGAPGGFQGSISGGFMSVATPTLAICGGITDVGCYISNTGATLGYDIRSSVATVINGGVSAVSYLFVPSASSTDQFSTLTLNNSFPFGYGHEITDAITSTSSISTVSDSVMWDMGPMGVHSFSFIGSLNSFGTGLPNMIREIMGAIEVFVTILVLFEIAKHT